MERLIAVRFPLHAIVYLNRRGILSAIACIYFMALLLNVHFLFSLRVVSVAVCKSNSTTIGLEIAKKATEPFSYNFGHYSLVTFVVTAQIIPMLLLIALNSSLIFSLRKLLTNEMELRRNRSESSNAQQNERQISMVVAAIIASFVLFNIPSAVVWTIHLAYGLNIEMPKEFHTAVEIANILVPTGKTINFIVYYCCSEQFRGRLRGNNWYPLTLQNSHTIFARARNQKHPSINWKNV